MPRNSMRTAARPSRDAAECSDSYAKAVGWAYTKGRATAAPHNCTSEVKCMHTLTRPHTASGRGGPSTTHRVVERYAERCTDEHGWCTLWRSNDGDNNARAEGRGGGCSVPSHNSPAAGFTQGGGGSSTRPGLPISTPPPNPSPSVFLYPALRRTRRTLTQQPTLPQQGSSVASSRRRSSRLQLRSGSGLQQQAHHCRLSCSRSKSRKAELAAHCLGVGPQSTFWQNKSHRLTAVLVWTSRDARAIAKAPCSRRTRATPRWPRLAAWCSGVQHRLSC
mmetsp:Transcript_34034/g.77069  ORF Transcript_34034/g.77069 Transcript_34034/m.77069 type:complete len:277 (+) Transcript_34034:295-1125(+)